jgi:hypothetical protein
MAKFAARAVFLPTVILWSACSFKSFCVKHFSRTASEQNYIQSLSAAPLCVQICEIEVVSTRVSLFSGTRGNVLLSWKKWRVGWEWCVDDTSAVIPFHSVTFVAARLLVGSRRKGYLFGNGESAWVGVNDLFHTWYHKMRSSCTHLQCQRKENVMVCILVCVYQ